MILAVAQEVPAYGGSALPGLERNLRTGVSIALSRLLDLLGSNAPALDGPARRIYSRLGAVEFREGRGLDTLQAAYRTGARVTWDQFARAALAAEVAPQNLVALAESIFVYIDELATASVAGHTAEASTLNRQRDLTRARLAEALLDGEAVSAPSLVRRLAEEAAWPLPGKLAVALVPAAPGRALPPAPPDALILQRDDEVIAILPDPSGPGRRKRLTAGLSGQIYVGTVRPPEEAALSLDHARRVRDLVATGILPASHPVMAADHLLELVVTADRALIAELSRKALAPLDGLAPAKRTVVLETLDAWLRHQGERAAIAEDLHIHPQTVSYRMGRLTELFGEALADPRRRLSLALALMAGGPAGRTA